MTQSQFVFSILDFFRNNNLIDEGGTKQLQKLISLWPSLQN